MAGRLVVGVGWGLVRFRAFRAEPRGQLLLQPAPGVPAWKFGTIHVGTGYVIGPHEKPPPYLTRSPFSLALFSPHVATSDRFVPRADVTAATRRRRRDVLAAGRAAEDR